MSVKCGQKNCNDPAACQFTVAATGETLPSCAPHAQWAQQVYGALGGRVAVEPLDTLRWTDELPDAAACPHCGAEATTVRAGCNEHGDFHFVECDTCHAEGPKVPAEVGMARAVIAWNMRAL